MRLSPHALSLAAALLALTGVGARAQAPDYKVVAHVAGPDGGWDYASFDAASRRLYVARTAGVMALDVDSGVVSAHAAPAARGHSAVPLPGGKLLVTSGGTDSAAIIDAATGQVLATLPMPKGPDGAIYDPKSGLAFVAAHAGGVVAFVDPVKLATVATVQTGGVLEFAAVDGHGRLWINSEKAGEIIAVDIAQHRMLFHKPLDGCEGPSGLAYAPAADRLLAACDGVAVVIDPASGAVVGKIPIGDGADAVIYDPVRKRLFVPSGDAGTLAVIDASSPTLKAVQTVATLPGARTGAVDPKTGKLYLPTAKFAPAVGGGRPTAVPGSFELVVVGP
jgi:DNA-binding beta-propeller fold protein YncE